MAYSGETAEGPPIVRAVCAAFVLAALPVAAHPLTPSQVFDTVKDAVVVVKSLDAGGGLRSQGSGVLIASERVATNCHVVKAGASYEVRRGERRVAATLHAEDRGRDICLLDAAGIGGEPVQLGQATTLKVGDPVYAVGAPRGLELSLSDGIVAQLRGGPPPVIQTTAAISPGSSGGGLFDRDGRLVGLTTLYVKGGQSLNFAMPVERIGEVKPGGKPVVGSNTYSEWLEGAVALEKLKDWQGLLEWCWQWTQSEPQSASAWRGLGVAYGALTRYRDALGAFRQAIRIDPTDARTWYNLGVAYVKTGNRTSALESVRELRRREPALADRLFNLIVPR